MILQTSGTIVWISAFYNRTGLAGGSRACVKALHNAGFKIRVVSVNDVQPGIDDCDINLFKLLEQTTVTPPVTAIVFHNPDEAWLNIQLPEPHVRIMMTGFVGKNVPPLWIDICNRMDQVWLGSEVDKSVWIGSGINPEKVRLISCPHIWQFLPIVPISSKGRYISNKVFRFLSMGTFSPNRRWDSLIQAYLEEFSGNSVTELYLRVNYPTWHPVPGQPQRDLSNLISMLRDRTQSDAKIVIDDALGTRLNIMRLIDSCDVYASSDVSGATPIAEAAFRRRLIIASEEWNDAEDILSLRRGSAFLIPSSTAEIVSVQGDMLNYLPQYQGVSWPRLDIKLTRQALREAFELLPDKRQRIAISANRHFRSCYSIDRLVSRMVRAIKNAWAYKQQQAIALNDVDLQPKLSLINLSRQHQCAFEALPVINDLLRKAQVRAEVLALCGLVMIDVNELSRAESVWQQLPWYTSLTHPDVMALLEGLLQKGSKEITIQHLIELAKSAKLEGAWMQAIKLFKIAIEQSGSDKSIAFLWHDLAYCYLHSGDEITAQKMLETACNLAPNNLDILSALAKHYLDQEQYDNASRLISLGLSQSPGNADLLILKGNLAIEQNDFNHAFEIFQQVSVNAPQTLALEVTVEQLALITGKKAISIKKDAGGRPQMEAGAIYTRNIMADAIAQHGFEIGEFTYGKPIIRWWGEDVKLKIGRYCSIADNVKIYLGGNHRYKWVTTYPFPSPPMNQDWPNANHRGLPVLPATNGDVIIGNDVWIGDDAVILSGVTVGHGAVIAARTVVTKDVQPYAIVGGNPARSIRNRFSDESIAMLLELKWWDWHVDKINEYMPNLCSEDVLELYTSVKSAMSAGVDFSAGVDRGDLFTGERAMPLAPNMDPQIMREHWARYRHVSPMVAGKRVLDVACGAGYGSDMLAETARQVIGGDISPETIAYCRNNYRRDNLKFEVLDIRNIPYPDKSFEMVNSFETLEHVTEGERFLIEVTRILTDDGIFVVSTPLGGPVGNPYHVAYYQSGTFASYLLGFFEEVNLMFQSGDQFSEKTKSPYYAPTFTGEYALAFCRKPRLRIQALTSIIILTLNQLEHTKLCLQSIEHYTTQPYELIIVDNGSTDGTLAYYRNYSNCHNNVRVIANKENLGFAAGNNQGLALANGNYVLLLNNDTVVTEGWLSCMLSVFERYLDVGIVGPVSNYVTGPQLINEVSYRNLDEMHNFAKQLSAEHVGQTMESQRLVGFCLLAKREVIDQIGGLDEQFGIGNFEDDDFCLRAATAGYKARIAQDAFIHHTGSQTFKGAGINCQQTGERNWEIFKAKWKLPQDLPIGGNYTLNLDTRDLSQYYIPLEAQSGKFQSVAVKEIPSLIHPEFTEGMTSIIIPVQSIHLNECVESIKKYTEDPHEIILIEHDAAPKLKKQIAKAVKGNHNYKFIKIDKNVNFTQSLDEGINQSTGEYIVILFDDVMVCEGWLSDMHECLKSEKNIGIVGAMSDDASSLQRAESIDFKSPKNRLSFRETNRQKRVPTRNLDGFCMLFRRDLLIRIGLFDEIFGKDKHVFDDFCIRAELAGYNNVIAGDVFVHNQGGINRLLSQDKTLFDEKWKGIDTSIPLTEKSLIENQRNAIHKFFQDVHLKNQEPAALFFPSVDPRLLCDVSDLPRLRLYIKGIETDIPDTNLQLFNDTNIADRIHALSLEDLKKIQGAWDIIVLTASDLVDQNLEDFLISLNFKLLVVSDSLSSIDEDSRVKLMEYFSANGLEKIHENPDVFFWKDKSLWGEYLFSKGFTADAVRNFERALADNPANENALNNLGVISYQLNRYEAAEKFMVKAVSLNRRNINSLNNLVQLYMTMERFEDAAGLLLEITGMNPEQPEPWYLLGLCQERLNQLDRAFDAFKKAEKFDGSAYPMPEGLHVQLAKSLFAKNNSQSRIPPKKILVINNLYPPQEMGGYGRLLFDFTNILRNRGHSIYVLTSDSPYLGNTDGDKPDVHRSLVLFGGWEGGVCKTMENPADIIRIVRKNIAGLEQVLKEFRPDACLLGNIDFLSKNIIDPMLDKKIPIIHHLGNQQPGYVVNETPQNRLYHLAAASNWLKNEIQNQGYPLKDISVVFPGALVEEFRMRTPPALDKLRIVYASIVLPYKGPHILINALKRLHDSGIDFYCSIAGTSTDQGFVDSLKSYVAGTGMEEKIHFLGFLAREELKNLFARHNVLVFPSIVKEAFGISQVEAMAAGLTVVTSGTGGAKEIVEHGVSGIIFKTEDDVSLAEELIQLTKDPLKCQQIALAGQRRAIEKFDIERSVDSLESCFARLLQTKGIR